MTVPRVNHRRPQGVFFIMQLVDEGKGAESEKSSITSNREEYSDPEEKTACCVIRYDESETLIERLKRVHRGLYFVPSFNS